MRDISEKRAIELKWRDVCDIASDEIKDILGLRIPCGADVTGTEFWALTFEDRCLPLPKLCQLLQAIQATPDDWEDALPDEGGTDVNALGMVQAEKLIGRNLKISWKHRLITADSLWLVGVTAANH
jgi:hypothetical protein